VAIVPTPPEGGSAAEVVRRFFTEVAPVDAVAAAASGGEG